MTSPPPPVLVARYRTDNTTYRTRSRSSLAVSTRSMARGVINSALGEMAKNGSVSGMSAGVGAGAMSQAACGGKRKSDEGHDEDQRRTKSLRFSSENRARDGAGTRSIPAGSFGESRTTSPVTSTNSSPPTTPVRALQPYVAPTPAREILKAGYGLVESHVDSEKDQHGSTIPSFIIKPPTPPRARLQYTHALSSSTEVVPIIGEKRCRSPDQNDPNPSKRLITNDAASEVPIVLHTDKATVSASDQTMSYSTQTLGSPAQLTSTSAASPRRALESISRFGTPKKESTGSRLDGNPSTARIAPTIPIPFSFITSRTITSQTDKADSLKSPPPFSYTASGSTADVVDGMQVDQVTEPRPVRNLPKGSNMGPPSRLPVKTLKQTTLSSTTTLSLTTTSTSAAASSKPTAGPSKSKPRPQIGIAEHRPRRRVVSGPTSTKPLAVLDESNIGSKPEAPIRRKPSYPSSLGSGPLAKPRSRLVSGPIQPPRSFSTSAGPTSSQEDVEMGSDPVKQTIRSVSDPVGRPRASLSSRRESLMSDTSRSLAEMSEALAKLKVRRDDTTEALRPLTAVRPKAAPSVLSEVSQSAQIANLNTSQPVATSSRLSSVHRPRASVAGADVTMDDENGSLAVLMSTDKGEKALRGVVAFVDVRTDDGGCAGDIWADMLHSLGAKVNVRLTTAVTHIIYKSGLKTTIEWYRRQDQEEKPFIVGVGWLLKSKKAGERLDETEFTVDFAVEDIFQKKRKSMEPKALAAASQNVLPDFKPFNGISLAARMSMQYAPRIGSPLKKGYTRDALDD